jgi:membrane protein
MAWKERLSDWTGPLVRWSRKTVQRANQVYERLTQRYGVVAVIDQAVRDFFRHGMTLHAGNFAYSAFLAIFPLILIVAAIIGFLFSYNTDVMAKVTEAIRNMLPDMPTTVNAASESLVRLRNVVGVLGIIGLFWTVSKIAYAIQTGFEEVWETYKRSFVKKRVFAFGIMFLLLLVGIIGLTVTFISSQFFSWLNRETGPVFSALAVVFSAILSPLATILIFAVLYRRIPLVRPRWKEVLWGAVTAALLLDAAEYGLGIYFTKISNNQALYGSLGVVLGIVLWLYVVGILIFFGAEIVHVLQQRWGTGGEDRDEPQGVQLKLPREDI